MYKSYLHVERLGSDETDGILCGTVEVTPKMDGTNGCVWYDGKFHAGSRTREVSLSKDNADFCYWFNDEDSPHASMLREICREHPNWIIYGEWMGYTKFVGNIKDYNTVAKMRFFVFDVFDTTIGQYLPRKEWIKEAPSLEVFSVPVLAILENPTVENILNVANQNRFMLDHANHLGEGVVLRNDNFINKYGRQARAKLVLDEYKQNKSQKQNVLADGQVEQNIVSTYVTDAELTKAVEKTAEFFNEDFDKTKNKMVGFYLNLVLKDCVWDECANWVKRFKPQNINIALLKNLTQIRARNYIGL